MMNRFLSGLLALIFLPGTIMGAVEAREKSYSADRYDVRMQVVGDNQLRITETIAFNFTGGPFTYIYRDLALNELDAATDFSATLDGAPMPEGSGEGQVEIERGDDSVDVTWHFAPTTDQRRTVTITYLVSGAIIRESGQDVIAWQVIPGDHEYSIGSSELTIEYPEAVEMASAPLILERGYSIVEQAPGLIRLDLGSVEAEQSISLRASFPQASLTSAMPAWQAGEQAQKAATSRTVPIALGAGLVSLLGVGAAANAFYRKKFPVQPQAIPLGVVTRPPANRPPAIAAAIKMNNNLQLNFALGTLVNLAQRGWFSIEMRRKTGIFGGQSFILLRNDDPQDDLRPHEEWVLDRIFDQGRHVEADLQAVCTDLQSQWKGFAERIQMEMEEEGLLDAIRVKQHTNVLAVALVGILLSVLLCALIAVVPMLFPPAGINWWMVGIAVGAAVMIGAVVLLAFAATWPQLTDAAREEQRRWQAFSDYLNEPGRSSETLQVAWFEPNLAYAMAFGIAEHWIKAFQKQGITIPAAWMVGDVTNALEQMNAMAAFAGAASTYGDGGAAGAAGAGGGGGGSGAG